MLTFTQREARAGKDSGGGLKIGKQHFILNSCIHISSNKAQRKHMNRKQIRQRKLPSLFLAYDFSDQVWRGIAGAAASNSLILAPANTFIFNII